MCTVTIFPLPGEVIRLACNRDEQISRPQALPPRIVTCGGHRVIMPIDPAGGGTWIAANDAGLVMTLLNFNPPGHEAGARPISRGRIIPQLIGYENIALAVEAAHELDAGDYGPFRLIMVETGRVAQVVSNCRSIDTMELTIGGPLLFTSSGLGDDLVEGPRRALFEQMVSRDGCSAEVQDAFHRHSWRERSEWSVCMRRKDARTVSHTVIEVQPETVSLCYHPVAPDETAMDHCASFPLFKPVAI